MLSRQKKQHVGNRDALWSVGNEVCASCSRSMFLKTCLSFIAGFHIFRERLVQVRTHHTDDKFMMTAVISLQTEGVLLKPYLIPCGYCCTLSSEYQLLLRKLWVIRK